MVDNNILLKKLNRRDLLQILLEQTKRIENLEEQIIDYEKQLEMKKVSFTDVGNLAEASLQLTDIFKNAEEAISIYKSNIEESLKNKERDFQEECQRIKEKIELEKEVKYQKRVEQIEKINKKVKAEDDKTINLLKKQVEKLQEKVNKLQAAKEDIKDNTKVKTIKNKNTPKPKKKKCKKGKNNE